MLPGEFGRWGDLGLWALARAVVRRLLVCTDSAHGRHWASCLLGFYLLKVLLVLLTGSTGWPQPLLTLGPAT